MLQRKDQNKQGQRGQAYKYKGWVDCFFKIYQQEGLEGYVKGVGEWIVQLSSPTCLLAHHLTIHFFM
jgi:hypothetical protein